MKILLLKNAKINNKLPSFTKDILIFNNEIVKIAPSISSKDITSLELGSIEIMDAKNQLVIPGFIDGHQHLLGAAGETGYETRAPEIPITAIISSGITTVIGLLGVDNITRSLSSLYAKVRALDNEGITAKMLTGSYHIPSTTITDTVTKDLYFFPEIIGLGEIAISDRRSSHNTTQELIQFIKATVRTTGAKKQKGVVVFHIGSERSGLKIIENILKEVEIPPESLILTHINRNKRLIKKARDLASKGCYIDVSSLYFQDETRFIRPEKALFELLENGVPLDKLLVSSDAGCYIETSTLTQPKWLFDAFQNVIKNNVLKLEEAIQIFSTNPARAYGLEKKGLIAVGKDADLLLLDDTFSLKTVITKGEVAFHEGIYVKNGYSNGQVYKTL